jgi:hypothetical protein
MKPFRASRKVLSSSSRIAERMDCAEFLRKQNVPL